MRLNNTSGLVGKLRNGAMIGAVLALGACSGALLPRTTLKYYPKSEESTRREVCSENWLYARALAKTMAAGREVVSEREYIDARRQLCIEYQFK